MLNLLVQTGADQGQGEVLPHDGIEMKVQEETVEIGEKGQINVLTAIRKAIGLLIAVKVYRAEDVI